MIKKIIILLVFFYIPISIFAQDAEPEFEKDKKEEVKKESRLIEKLAFGGSFSLSLGSYTRIAVSPIIGFRPLDPVLIGIEGRFAYIKDTYNGFQTYYYGAGPFARFIFFKGIYAQIQSEYMNYDEILFKSYSSRRIWNSAYLIGGGYSQQIGERSYSFISILWDINETAATLYESPIIRFGIIF